MFTATNETLLTGTTTDTCIFVKTHTETAINSIVISCDVPTTTVALDALPKRTPSLSALNDTEQSYYWKKCYWIQYS